MRHKPTVTQVTRHIVQAVAFVLMPGLFIQTFAALGSVVAAVARGSFSPGALASELALLAVVLGVTALWGRFFCGYLCSFGAMGDLAYAAASGLRPRGLRVSQRADGALKYVKFVVLAAIAVLCWCAGLGLWAGFDPWTPFGMLASGNLSGAVGIGLVTLVLVVAASTVVERFFCRYLCPLGAVFALVSRGRLFRIRRREDTCTGCQACTRSCSMGIVVHEGDRVRSGECVDCMRCLDACAPHSLRSNAKPAVAGTATALATMGLVYAGRIATDGTAYVQTTSSPTAQGSYKDGTYTGSGQGFRGTTSVTVTVSGGNITNIEVSSYEDDDQFFNQAKSTVIQEIIQSQGVDVDTVSGATYSSNGILEAVANAVGASFDNPNSTMSSGHGGHGH